MSPLLLISLLLLTVSATCPTYSCISMPANQCGNHLSATEIQISSTGCETGFSCSLPLFLNWAVGAVMKYDCVADAAATGSQNSWTYQPCLSKVSGQTWKAGGTVITCSADSDCMKSDSTFETGACKCVPRSDGKGVCAPHPSNTDVFSGYWTECSDSGNRIENEDNYNYWSYAFQYWVYMQSNLNCTATFLEIQTYNELMDKYSGAIALWFAVALAGI